MSLVDVSAWSMPALGAMASEDKAADARGTRASSPSVPRHARASKVPLTSPCDSVKSTLDGTYDVPERVAGGAGGSGAATTSGVAPSRSPSSTAPRARARLTGEAARWHGWLGSAEWPAPRCVAKSDEAARPGYDSRDASEYLDSASVLRAKVDVLVRMLKASDATVCYTGAGISTAAGIGDYASKAKKSVARKLVNPSLNRRQAPPTQCHRVMTALQKRGLLHEWVDQNHDMCGAKAGYPLSRLNPIHGTWFDRKNRVKMMDESLEPRLLERLVRWAESAKLTLAIGTSLCGMNADQVATTPAEKARADPDSLGGMVIVNLQKTAHDDDAALRIFATCDGFAETLRKRLRLRVKTVHLDQPHWNK